LIPKRFKISGFGEDEAGAIGIEAYLYFYSIVTMDVTRKQLTNAARRPSSPPHWYMLPVRKCGTMPSVEC
jgi:hypothetical protein